MISYGVHDMLSALENRIEGMVLFSFDLYLLSQSQPVE